jgi:hypothetical protein
MRLSDSFIVSILLKFGPHQEPDDNPLGLSLRHYHVATTWLCATAQRVTRWYPDGIYFVSGKVVNMWLFRAEPLQPDGNVVFYYKARSFPLKGSS